MNAKIDKERLVTTKFGKVVPRKECRYIREEYYKMDEECFKFNGKWYRTNSGFLIQDVETDEWMLKGTEDLLFGIAINKKGQIVSGNFKKNMFKNISIDSYSVPSNITKESSSLPSELYASNMEVVKKLGLVEDISSGIFMKPSKASSKIAINGNYHFNVDYSFEHSGDIIKEHFHEYYNSLNPSISNNVRLLKDLSFGWEFETTDGYIHPRHLIKTGLIPLRDGSINGYEFATCPMRKGKGVHVLKDAAKVLSKYTTKNTSCSLHLHLGNLPKSEDYLLTIYTICKKLENEIFSLFPDFIRNTSSYKDRDYCKSLPAYTSISRVIDWLAGTSGYYEARYKGLGARAHPADADNNRKWNIDSRYYWVNFVPYVFGGRGTVEFRLHTATTNETKLINWLFICAGIINFAKDTSRSNIPMKLKLSDVFEKVYSSNPYLVKYLNKYVQHRKDFMKKSSQLGDYIGTVEMQKDLKFTFPYEGKKTLVDV